MTGKADNVTPLVGDGDSVDLKSAYDASHVQEVLDKLDSDLIGLAPVKARIRDIAALLLIDKARRCSSATGTRSWRWIWANIVGKGETRAGRLGRSSLAGAVQMGATLSARYRRGGFVVHHVIVIAGSIELPGVRECLTIGCDSA